MMCYRVLLVPLALAALVSSAPAADFGIFGKKAKSNPAERVPELLIQLKTGRDEAQRVAAAEELRLYDPKAFPEITTALIDALGRDASVSVRTEAADSLGKLRPIAQKVGYALEQAVGNDGTLRVRLAARQALWQYHLVGYRSGKPLEPDKGTSDTTVSVPPGPSTAAMPQRPHVVAKTAQSTNGQFRETAEPPLADPPAQIVEGNPKTVPAIPVAQPQLGRPSPFILIPTTPQSLQPLPLGPEPVRPTTRPDGQGPVLPPPG